MSLPFRRLSASALNYHLHATTPLAAMAARRRLSPGVWLVLFGLLGAPTGARAQMIVEGRVFTESGAPLAGASVSVADLGVVVRTNKVGRYSFIVPATRVLGQRVELVARHGRHGTHHVALSVTGGSFVHDLVLPSRRPPKREQPAVPVSPDTVRPLSLAPGATLTHHVAPARHQPSVSQRSQDG